MPGKRMGRERRKEMNGKRRLEREGRKEMSRKRVIYTLRLYPVCNFTLNFTVLIFEANGYEILSLFCCYYQISFLDGMSCMATFFMLLSPVRKMIRGTIPRNNLNNVPAKSFQIDACTTSIYAPLYACTCA